MKRFTAMILAILCFATMGLGAFAADPTPTDSISLAALIDGEVGKRTYTEAQQVKQLASFIPTTDQALDTAPEKPGNVPIQMLVSMQGAKRDFRFYSGNYAVERLTDGSSRWYTVPTGVWDLLTALTDWNPFALQDTLKYKNETLTHVYSLRYKDRTYHQVLDSESVRRITTALEEKKPDENVTIGNVGFLLFTEKDRYAVYLDAASDPELVDLSVEFVDKNPRIQWISFMDPALITSVSYSARLGGSYSLTPSTEATRVELETTDRDTINQISAYLKNMLIAPETKRTEVPVKYPDSPYVFQMDIAFESGTIYHIEGTNAQLTISASTMDGEYNTYTAASSQMKALRDFVSIMPGAKITAA